MIDDNINATSNRATKADMNINRIKRVCSYIEHNLDEDISLQKLSEIAICSKYHFHRVFKSFVGISAIQYLQLARLKRASFRLAFEPINSITDIAFEAKFDSPEAFSRAFSRTLGQSPSQFRSEPEWQVWHSTLKFNSLNRGVKIMDISIVEFAERQVALIEHKGDPERVFDSAAKFIAWRKETGLSPIQSSDTFAIAYSDPKETKKEDFRFDICGTHNGEVPENSYGIKSGLIPGGRCAVARHKGSHDHISETVYYMYQKWLANSSEELRDFPCFFHYLNFVHEVDECDLVTDIYLPLI